MLFRSQNRPANEQSTQQAESFLRKARWFFYYPHGLIIPPHQDATKTANFHLKKHDHDNPKHPTTTKARTGRNPADLLHSTEQNATVARIKRAGKRVVGGCWNPDPYLTSGLPVMLRKRLNAQMPMATPVAANSGYTCVRRQRRVSY